MTKVRTLLIIFAMIFSIMPVVAQDDDTDMPDGIFSLSPEGQQLREEQMTGAEDVTEADLIALEALFSSCESIPLIRSFFIAPDVDLPDDVGIESLNTDTITGAWFVPQGAVEDSVMLYVHGGAFIFNSVETYTPFMAWLAAYSEYTVFAVNYRLAPEHPFPAGLDDVEVAYRWLLTQGYTADNIILAGDSAGGNLALGLLLRLRDANEEMPSAAWLNAPVLDFTRSASTESMFDPTGIFEGMYNLMDDCYLNGISPTDPRVSPLFADLTGLPPLFLTAGTDEAGLGSLARFSRIARNSGVDTTLDVWDGMWHVWSFSDPILPESILLYEDVALWLDNVMGR